MKLTKLLILGLSIFAFLFTSNAQDIKIESGANMITTGNSNIIVGGDWQNDGNFSADQSTVYFRGISDQVLNGGSSTNFYNMEIDNTGNDVQIITDVNVANNLTLSNGDIDLQDNNIDLGTTGTIVGETETNRIKVSNPASHTGTITATRTINSGYSGNPANLGVTINTDKDLGSITITRGHQVQNGSGSFTSNTSIERYYNIPGIGQLDANNTVELVYWDAELNGHAEANLQLFQSITENTSTWWSPLDGTVDASSNVATPITTTTPYGSYLTNGPNWYGYTYNDIFTLASTDNPLPIELISFTGNCNDNFVTLEWATASEKNNEVFLIQRSENGEDFNTIGSVQGAGDSHQMQSYSFFDEEPLNDAYYRLKQIDFNGDYTYSDIINVGCGNNMEAFFDAYPNPFKEELYITAGNLPDSKVLIEIFSMDGKLQKNYHFNTTDFALKKELHLEDLVPSMYMIRLTSDDFVRTYKINKQ